ncbi:MAG: ATP-grasp domain-containing protein [Clostridia bacterium]|nr:ATP-grasp domain-containing protein [Clostridia bacterium]
MKAFKDLTVLVTAAGNQYMLGMAECLHDNGERNIRIVGVDMTEDVTVLQMMDAVYKTSRATSPTYIDELLDICKKEKVDIIMPIMSAELIALAENKDRFAEIGTIVSISNIDSLKICNNKYNLYSFMKQQGLTVPKFTKITTFSEFDDAIKYVGYPEKGVCIKATELSGSRGIRIIDPTKSRYDILFGEKPNSFFTSYEELKEILSGHEELPELMIMEYLPGEEFSVDLVADNGKVLYMCARQSNSILASIPQTATTFHEPRAYKLCEDIVKALHFDGNADFDFKYDETASRSLWRSILAWRRQWLFSSMPE